MSLKFINLYVLFNNDLFHALKTCTHRSHTKTYAVSPSMIEMVP